MHVDDGDVQGSLEWRQRAGMLRLTLWDIYQDFQVDSTELFFSCCTDKTRDSGAAECGSGPGRTMDSPIGSSQLHGRHSHVQRGRVI